MATAPYGRLMQWPLTDSQNESVDLYLTFVQHCMRAMAQWAHGANTHTLYLRIRKVHDENRKMEAERTLECSIASKISRVRGRAMLVHFACSYE